MIQTTRPHRDSGVGWRPLTYLEPGRTEAQQSVEPADRKPSTVSDSAGWLKRNAPEWIRTTGLILRRDALYPAELRAPCDGKRISRVLSPASRRRIISLGPRSRMASSSLPGTVDLSAVGAGRASSLIWPCSVWGLPCRSRYRQRGGLLHHRFTLACTLAGHRRSLLCCTFRRLATPGR